MSDGTIASNTARANEWLPYSHKPFYLGSTGNSDATDSNQYITQTTGDSNIDIKAEFIDEFNCGFYYELHHVSSGGIFYKKFTNSGVLVDTIYASQTSSNGRYWTGFASAHTPDIGLIVDPNPSFGNTFDDGDVYKIETPSLETMKKRRLYHGGYTSYIRMPYTEGVTFRTSIIPSNLKGVNITAFVGAKMSGGIQLRTIASREDAAGNKAVTVAFEWNINPQGAESTTASSTGYVMPAGETWIASPGLAVDIDPTFTGSAPFLAQVPASDFAPGVHATPSNSWTISGKAGHARIKSEYMTGAGSPAISAHNQWWPITIILG